MAGFFYQLGRLAGPKLRKAKWVLRSLTGSEAEAIQAEYEVGRDLAKALESEMAVDQDPNSAALVQGLGSRLANRVKNPHRKFRFQVVLAQEANAFALPGGFISVTRPMLELCASNPDELAFILGHEMGHVIRKHAMDRIMTNSVVSAAVRAVPVGGLIKSQLGNLVLGLLQQRYSQDQELDADQLGVRLARSAQFDPTAALQLLARLKARSGEAPGLSAYFSSHPPFELRIRQIDRFLKQGVP